MDSDPIIILIHNTARMFFKKIIAFPFITFFRDPDSHRFVKNEIKMLLKNKLYCDWTTYHSLTINSHKQNWID